MPAEPPAPPARPGPPLRLLVVDDEPPARARLRRLLAAVPDVVLVGEAVDGLDALAQAEALRPDALLLDVQMPEVSGLDVAASLPDAAQGGPAVVFVTAHDAHELRAFELAAVDYLLKPVAPERLAQALARLRLQRPSRQPLRGEAAPAARPAPQQLVVAERGQVQVLACADILWLEAADNYVTVHTRRPGAPASAPAPSPPPPPPLLRRTLEGLLADLGPGFARVHRSRAVALWAVAAVEAAGKGDATLRLVDGQRIGCSRAHRGALVAALQAAAGGPARPGDGPARP